MARSPGQGGPRRTHGLEVREGVVALARGQRQDPLQHHRDHHQLVGPGALERGQRVARVELAAQHQRRVGQHRQVQERPAPGVEQRRRDVRRPAVLERDAGQDRDGRVDAGLATWRALRGAGRAGGQDHRPGRTRGGLAPCVEAAVDEVLDQVVLDRALRPGDDSVHLDSGAVDQVLELLVVHDRRRLLTRAHLAQLRTREGGVEVEDVRAELGERDRHLDHVAVVAAQHGDRVAGLDAAFLERVRQPGAALVDLAPGELAQLVDDADGVGRALRQRLEAARHAEAPLLQGQPHRGEPVRRDRPDDPGQCENLGGVRLLLGLGQEGVDHDGGAFGE